jgi:hypothetical protein
MGGWKAAQMTDQPENQPKTNEPASPGGAVELDGTSYMVSPTAFPSHFQVMTGDGKLVGLIEFAGADGARRILARPASGAGMTLALLTKIAEAASSSGIVK